MPYNKVKEYGLENLIDETLKLADSVKGAAGSVRVLGTIPLVPAKLQQNPLVFPCMVVEVSPISLLLGMDFLRAYSC